MRRLKQRLILVGLIALLCCTAVFVPNVSAHRSGCHRWHSCPSDSGSYVCGDLGYNAYCGSSTYVAPEPIITTKDEVTEEPIAYSEVEKNNSNEYTGYRKLISQGESGARRIVTRIIYSDGQETSRSIADATEIRTAKDTVYEVGTRVRPAAYIDYITESENQGFWSFLVKDYDISASAAPSKSYALIKNGTVVKLSSSSKEGLLNFDKVGLKSEDILEIGTYEGGKFLWFMPSAKSISEKHTVNTEKETVTSAYDTLHNKQSDRTNESKKVLECSDEVRNTYLNTLDTTDKALLKFVDVERIYYTEIPCDITLKK